MNKYHPLHIKEPSHQEFREITQYSTEKTKKNSVYRWGIIPRESDAYGNLASQQRNHLLWKAERQTMSLSLKLGVIY